MEVAREHRKGKRDSDGGRAFIKTVGEVVHHGTFEVKCAIGTGNCLSQDVKEARLSPVPMDTTARRCKGDHSSRLSLLSSHHAPRRRSLPPQKQSSVPSVKKKSAVINTAKPLVMSKRRPPLPKLNSALNVLKIQNSKRPKRWLQIVEALSTGKQLNQLEKQLALSLHLVLRTMEDTAAAAVWGVTRQSVCGWEKKAKQANGLKTERKTRCDKGKTVFDSDKRWTAAFTPQHSFSKPAEHHGEPLTKQDLKEACAAASPDTKKRAELQSKQLLQQAPFRVSEPQRVLKLTNGSTTWQRLASQTSGGSVEPVSANAIAKCVMDPPNST